jgi:hypothetical protein
MIWFLVNFSMRKFVSCLVVDASDREYLSITKRTGTMKRFNKIYWQELTKTVNYIFSHPHPQFSNDSQLFSVCEQFINSIFVRVDLPSGYEVIPKSEKNGPVYGYRICPFIPFLRTLTVCRFSVLTECPISTVHQSFCLSFLPCIQY